MCGAASTKPITCPGVAAVPDSVKGCASCHSRAGMHAWMVDLWNRARQKSQNANMHEQLAMSDLAEMKRNALDVCLLADKVNLKEYVSRSRSRFEKG